MKKYIQVLLLSGLLITSFAACTGKADSDGHRDLEGSADPSNDGGKLGGSDAADSLRIYNDTTRMR